MSRFKPTLVVMLVGLVAGSIVGQQTRPGASRPAAGRKHPPDLQDVKYGPHDRNVLDLWKARSDKPTPLAVFIHGGGFRTGDKSRLAPQLLNLCLKSGISVAAINYRLSQHAPFPGPMHDSARAVQFLRYKSKEWNLDPKKVAATGGSAGAGISLWLAFHDDLAASRSEDLVARQSTRLSCAGVFGAQSSYDPRFIKKHIGGRAHKHPALPQFYGLKPGQIDWPRARRLFEEASPITHVSAGDPPVFMFYREPDVPLPADARPGQGIHHPRFGKILKEKLDALKLECILRHRDDYKSNAIEQAYREMVQFFLREFGRP